MSATATIEGNGDGNDNGDNRIAEAKLINEQYKVVLTERSHERVAKRSDLEVERNVSV